MDSRSIRLTFALFGLLSVISIAVAALLNVGWNWMRGRALAPTGDEWVRIAFLSLLLAASVCGIHRFRTRRGG